MKTNLGYKIEVHPFGTLPRYDVKAKRFKDMQGDTRKGKLREVLQSLDRTFSSFRSGGG